MHARHDEAQPARVRALDAPAPRLPLRAVSPVAARTARFVCDARTAWAVQRLPGIDGWQAALCDAAAAASERFVQPGVLELLHRAGPVYVTFDLAAHPSLDIAAWPGESSAVPLADAQRALRLAVAGVLLEPLLQRLAALGLELRIARLLRGIPARLFPADAAPVALSFTLEGRRYAAELTVPPALLGAFEDLHATQATDFANAALARAGQSVARRARLADCLIPGRAVLGSRRLPVETLRALMPGDVLLRSLVSGLLPLAADTALPAGATAIAAWGTPGLTRLHAPVTIDGRMLSITKEPTMTDELDPVRLDDSLVPDQPENPIEIGELDLPVQFEVDTVALPLSQLYALRPGYVLELPTPVAEAQLKLVTHGQTIGYGELVTVGEHLGVRILRMAHGDGPVQ
ncbi:type III secretion system cytoplasmic ring protein SctQ [Paraburkholderia fungorum]|uniref:type III secretion system cytoplasmic ring protein SctQ n=1 Tax=Paraburkholderia fungorum TaxID=134537 RepID=UPI0038B9CE90